MKNIEKLQAEVIEYGTAHEIREFASYERGADIELLEAALIKTNDIYQIRKMNEFLFESSAIERTS